MKTMINKKLGGVAVAIVGILIPTTTMAQDKFEVSLGADVVSKYVWRGFDQGSGASVQPSLMDWPIKEYHCRHGEAPASQISNQKNSTSR